MFPWIVVSRRFSDIHTFTMRYHADDNESKISWSEVGNLHSKLKYAENGRAFAKRYYFLFDFINEVKKVVWEKLLQFKKLFCL